MPKATLQSLSTGLTPPSSPQISLHTRHPELVVHAEVPASLSHLLSVQLEHSYDLCLLCPSLKYRLWGWVI